MLGFKILPSYIPAQLYSVQDNQIYYWLFVIVYGRKLWESHIQFWFIKGLFNSSVYGNINSLKQRSYGNDLCIFLKERTELENLQ